MEHHKKFGAAAEEQTNVPLGTPLKYSKLSSLHDRVQNKQIVLRTRNAYM